MTDFPDEDPESQSDRYRYVKGIPGCVCTCTTDDDGKYLMNPVCPRHCPPLFRVKETQKGMYGDGTEV